MCHQPEEVPRMSAQSLHHLAPFLKTEDLPSQRLTTYNLQMETTWAQHCAILELQVYIPVLLMYATLD